MATVHLLGIRHHGPGSARSVLAVLAQCQPAAILIEGPADAQPLLAQVDRDDLALPIALMLHSAEKDDSAPAAAFYPFAEYSPEWQALRHGQRHGIPVQFFDLPVGHRMALENQSVPGGEPDDPSTGATEANAVLDPDALARQALTRQVLADPIGVLAQLAGYEDGERFWDHLVEQQPHGGEVFVTLGEAMAALRAQAGAVQDPVEACREAWMRDSLRTALRQYPDGDIVVVCGAWHVPALQDLKATAKSDRALLKGLPKTRLNLAWIPWSNGRLTQDSGYGAGVVSPRWYEHLWTHSDPQHVAGLAAGAHSQRLAAGWLAQYAEALRAQHLDASSAQIIDAIRLIDALLSVRGRALPDLQDVQDALQSVLYHGQQPPAQLLQQMLVGERLGALPEGFAQLPIEADLAAQLKTLRLKQSATSEALELDLRKPFDRQRSVLFYRLRALDIDWAKPQPVQQSTGTWREVWTLSWQPELALKLAQASLWGQTVGQAAQASLWHQATQAPTLKDLTPAVALALLAGLEALTPRLLALLTQQAARQHDVLQLLESAGPLVQAWRYGSVRQMPTALLGEVLDSLLSRALIGLPAATLGSSSEAARALWPRLQQLDHWLGQLAPGHLQSLWQQTLLSLLDKDSLPALLSGWMTLRAHEQGWLDAAQTCGRMQWALSARQPDREQVRWQGDWFEGFLTDQAMILIHDQALWTVLDDWLLALPEAHLIELLPLLRRTTASFADPERRSLLDKAAAGQTAPLADPAQTLDGERVQPVLRVLQQIFAGTLPGLAVTIPLDSVALAEKTP